MIKSKMIHAYQQKMASEHCHCNLQNQVRKKVYSHRTKNLNNLPRLCQKLMQESVHYQHQKNSPELRQKSFHPELKQLRHNLNFHQLNAHCKKFVSSCFKSTIDFHKKQVLPKITILHKKTNTNVTFF